MPEIVTYNKKLIAGVAGIERLELRTEVGPYRSLDQSNRFKLYQQLSVLTPHIFIPMIKMSLTIIKGLRIVCKNPTKQAEYEQWSNAINLRNKIQMMVFLLCRDGTYIASITNKTKPMFDFEPTLMQHVSIYPVGYNPNLGTTVVLSPPFDRIIINEGVEGSEQELKRENSIYGALYPRIGVISDNKGRETYGIYGQSMLDSIENTLYDYLDITKGYAKFIKRYGYGRYHIDYTALEEFIKEGDIDQAIESLDKLSEEHAIIEENEDIIGAGFKIHELNTGGSNPNITEYKESLEKDIQIGLLQAPLTMGRAEGTTFASGYISEEDRMIALEGIQNIVADIVNNEIIRRRENAQIGQTIDVGIEFEELSKPKIESKDLNTACTSGWISIEEWRRRSGFPADRNPNETYMLQQSQQGVEPTENGTSTTNNDTKTAQPKTNTPKSQSSLNTTK